MGPDLVETSGFHPKERDGSSSFRILPKIHRALPESRIPPVGNRKAPSGSRRPASRFMLRHSLKGARPFSKAQGSAPPFAFSRCHLVAVAAVVGTRLIFESPARLGPLAERSLNRDSAVERLKAEGAAPVSRALTNAATTMKLLRLRSTTRGSSAGGPATGRRPQGIQSGPAPPKSPSGSRDSPAPAVLRRATRSGRTGGSPSARGTGG